MSILLEVGFIALWHGSIASIPAGWHLCDGAAGTPDLRGRFVVGASVALPPDSTGGAASHVHTFTGDGHLHALDPGVDIAIGVDFDMFTSTDPASGTTDSEANLPPYYALAYIMRV